MAIKGFVVVAALLAGACSSAAQVAPTAPTGLQLVKPAAIVVVGDSLGTPALGPYFATVRARFPAFAWVDAAIGSTSLRVDWQPGGRGFVAMLAAVQDVSPTVFCVHLGANDTVLQPAPTSDAVFTDLQRFAGAIAAAYPRAVVYVAEVGQVWTYGDKRAENAAVRDGIARAWRELPNVRQGPLLQDLTPDDGVHFTSPANAVTIADRWTAVLHGGGL